MNEQIPSPTPPFTGSIGRLVSEATPRPLLAPASPAGCATTSFTPPRCARRPEPRCSPGATTTVCTSAGTTTSYPERYRSVASRLMETFAGFLAHTDHHIGRVIHAIDQLATHVDGIEQLPVHGVSMRYSFADGGVPIRRSQRACDRMALVMLGCTR